MRLVPWRLGLGWVVCSMLCLSTSGMADENARLLDQSATLTGLTGLIRVPNAYVIGYDRGRIQYTPPMGMGYTSIGARSSIAAAFSPLPHFEGAFSLGTKSVDYDLAIHGKYLVRSAQGWMPAVSIGVVDVGRNGPLGSGGFVVATWPLLSNRAALTLGGSFSANKGLLAGLQIGLLPCVELQGEFDTERFNYGIVGKLGDRAFVRAANLNTGNELTVGYTVPLDHYAPRPVIAPDPPKVADQAVTEAMEKVKEALVRSGLEDVQVTVTHLTDAKEMSAAYDDRMHTVNQLDGLPNVLKTMAENAPEGTVALVVKLRRRSLVMAEYRVPLETYRRYATGQATKAELAEATEVTMAPRTGEMRGPQQETSVENSSFRHVDLVVSPGINTIVGTETGIFKIGAHARVEAVAPLGRGLQAQARVVYPIGGELVAYEPRRWRNDRWMLSYAWSPYARWLTQVIVGKFPGTTSGVVVEALRPIDARSLVYLVAGQTRNTRLDNKLYWLAEYWRFIPEWKVQLRVLGGRFLSADTGIGLDLIRQYGAFELSVGIRETSASRLVRLGVSLPLGPRTQPQQPSAIRVRVDDYLEQQLRSIIVGTNYLYLEDITARELSLGPDLRTTYLNRYRYMPNSGWWPGD